MPEPAKNGLMEDALPEEILQRFAGIARLYGLGAMKKLAAAKVCIVGLGGVGSWACEALARSGIGSFVLADMDEICATNTNRQLHAMTGNFGRDKVEVMAERIRAINPLAKVATEKIFVAPDSATKLFASGGAFAGCDLLADAIDGATNKAALIAACVAAKMPIVSSGGCAGKRDGLRVEIGDMAEAENDALLTCVRRILRSRYGFPKGGKKFGVPTVFSREIPASPLLLQGAAEISHHNAGGREAVPEMLSPAGGKPRAGTATFVTGAFGFALAQECVRMILAR
ncbi:MAG: tRNA threonylcarbamoyladenosine dehydratase [Opitutae bacterium]|nr:tRNA threonylcarbamoyladenosine dehydratase [Opitutae bacterium]